ncbi:tetratricopeptide repeat protein [Aspergillus stella-maris]|uniref:tetratricopeptide repeat protein n=1 Tax=Aspergillus stella-maris TaxID=1810926 RepID=UPI003CCDA7D0
MTSLQTPLPPQPPLSPSEPYFNLGPLSRHISTPSPECQKWFDRALIWTYCFNHDEAITCYKQAIAHDPNCAIAYWGVAFCSGSNYNKTWALFDARDKEVAIRQCHEYSQEALKRADGDGHVSPWERALIQALTKRFPSPEIKNTTTDLADCNRAYVDAMRDVYDTLGKMETETPDFDIITLFADSLMNMTPRKLYDASTGLPNPETAIFEVKSLLETALAKPGVESHPGPAHMYIHLMEMSATPESALPACSILRDMIPDTGHTYHMPAHIYVLIGDYKNAVEYNHRATLADDKYFLSRGGLTFYSYYRLHDYHSLIYAAMLGGYSKVALDATSRMEKTISEEILRVNVPALADWMEFFLAVRVHVFVRFGMWEDLLALQPLQVKELYCVTNVMRCYGRAIAYAATGRVEEAEKERVLFHEAAKYVPETRLDFPNKITVILHVASAMLDGEIEYRKANLDTAFRRLRDAIELEDALPFAEPWGWMLPARHAFAALSLEQGKVEDAAQAYAEDLGVIPTPKRSHQHPGNVWALHGYHECLVRMGRWDEADEIKVQLDGALQNADVEITSSCFCRLGNVPSCQGEKGNGCHGGQS